MRLDSIQAPPLGSLSLYHLAFQQICLPSIILSICRYSSHFCCHDTSRYILLEMPYIAIVNTLLRQPRPTPFRLSNLITLSHGQQYSGGSPLQTPRPSNALGKAVCLLSSLITVSHGNYSDLINTSAETDLKLLLAKSILRQPPRPVRLRPDHPLGVWLVPSYQALAWGWERKADPAPPL